MKHLMMALCCMPMPAMASVNFAAEQAQYQRTMEGQTNSIVWLAALLISIVLCGAAGMWLGDMKKRGIEGALLGAILGPIGLIVTVLLPPGVAKMQAHVSATSISADGNTLVVYGLVGLCLLLGVFILFVNNVETIYGWLN